VDFAANAAMPGSVRGPRNDPSIRNPLSARSRNAGSRIGVSVIVVETDYHDRVAGYSGSWWDVPIAEVSESDESAGSLSAGTKKRG